MDRKELLEKYKEQNPIKYAAKFGGTPVKVDVITPVEEVTEEPSVKGKKTK